MQKTVWTLMVGVLIFSVLMGCSALVGCGGASPVGPLPGEPGIEFTYIPPHGSFNNLKGKVTGVNPSDYRIAVYIYVSGWWTKPYWNRPKTSISSNGSWICDITTGGNDEFATVIRAYLIKATYDPPLAPQVGLPPDPPTEDVLDMAEAIR